MLVACLCLPDLLPAAEDLTGREEQAIKSAVERVAPSVVRIETVGGLEQVGKLLVGTGPTTGLVVSSDGYIVSSAFNFVQKPASILVALADGKRLPAKLVATDHNRMLVLLKVEAAAPLPEPELVSEGEIRPGLWSLAVGRTFEGGQPNVSVGIVSAVKRIWGKALQTDAKISPSNYGGPLIDIRGRVLGVLVPMAPEGAGAVAGVDWYDSGIGFAVPLAHIQSVLPRWKDGDLHPGVLGVSFKAGDANADPATIGACRANSPAYKAGLKVGDTIVEVDGRTIIRQTQVKENIVPHYAGDTVRLVVLRGEERLERDVVLVEKLEPYQFPFLGVLPQRGGSAQGVVVRYVYAESPAAKAGIKPGETIVALGGQPVENRAILAEKVASLERPASGPFEVQLQVRRGSQVVPVTLRPGTLPEAVPAELPPVQPARPAPQADRPTVGRFDFKVAEFPHDSVVYVPENYHQDVPQGVLIWLSADGSYDADELVERYRAACDRDGLILFAPQTVEPPDAKSKRKWEGDKDAEFIGKALEQLGRSYTIDRTRVVAFGRQGGAAMAYKLGFTNRDWIRGVAVLDAPAPSKPAENEPIYRLAFYLTKAGKATSAKLVEPSAKALRDLKYPVTVEELGDEPRDLNPEELAELLRWIDTLDRI